MVIFCAVILYCSSGFFGYINHFIVHGCIVYYNSLEHNEFFGSLSHFVYVVISDTMILLFSLITCET